MSSHDQQKKSPVEAPATQEAPIPSPAHDTQAANLKAANLGVERELTINPAQQRYQGQYGVRPRQYKGYLNKSNEAEKRFAKALPEVTAFIRERIAVNKQTFQIDQAELATNFIMEGGVDVLNGNTDVSQVSSYGQIGCDGLINHLEALTPWLHPSVLARIAGSPLQTFEQWEKANQATDGTDGFWPGHSYQYNTASESGERVRAVRGLTIEEALYANAGMYAHTKALASAQLRDKGVAMETLDSQSQEFWTTAYFNAGPGTAKKMLDKHGVGYAKEKWTGAEPEGIKSARHNALLRSVTAEYMRETIYDGDGKEPKK